MLLHYLGQQAATGTQIFYDIYTEEEKAAVIMQYTIAGINFPDVQDIRLPKQRKRYGNA